MEDPEYRREYDNLAGEFELARTLIEARANAGLTQEQLAKRMETSQSAVTRMESGKILPSGRTLEQFANCGRDLGYVRFRPVLALIPCWPSGRSGSSMRSEKVKDAPARPTM